MNAFIFDWKGALAGAPVQWIASGLALTLCVTLVASVFASFVALLLTGLRVSTDRVARAAAVAFIGLFRNTPLLVQLLFWYFAAYATLPDGVRAWATANHPWLTLPGGIRLVTPEFLCAAWGLALFGGAFIAEELRTGLLAIPPGQAEAARSQGFGYWARLRHILLPQALANAWQPIVGQYLNLMKLSSLASGIGLAELTYRAREVESFNAHAVEAYAVGSALYLAIGLAMGLALARFGPRRAAATAGREAS